MAKKEYLDSTGLATLVGQIDLKYARKKDLTVVYKIKGSKAFADLPALDGTDVAEGFVYNITDDFVTTDDFIEGAGHEVAAGTNIVAVNVGTEDAPQLKWDLLAMGVQVDGYQTKKLVKPLTVFTADKEYATADALPANTSAAADIVTGTLAVLTDEAVEGNLYRATVAADSGDITWALIGNQKTVEGSLEFLGTVCPNTPITDDEIKALFED